MNTRHKRWAVLTASLVLTLELANSQAAASIANQFASSTTYDGTDKHQTLRHLPEFKIENQHGLHLLASYPVISGDHSAMYFKLALPSGSVINMVVVDLSSHHWKLRAISNDSLANVSQTARRCDGDIAINGGFFDTNNGRSTSYVIDEGKVTADPRNDPRLIKNASVHSYLQKILSRSELREASNEDGQMNWDISAHSDTELNDVKVVTAIQAGPQLLPTYNPEKEAFRRTSKTGKVMDSINTTLPEARTAVGLMPDGKLLLVAVDTPSKSPDGHGVTLPQLVQIFKDFGATKAVNFDGGTSTTMYLRLRDQQGNQRPAIIAGGSRLRAVKSVLLLKYSK